MLLFSALTLKLRGPAVVLCTFISGRRILNGTMQWNLQKQFLCSVRSTSRIMLSPYILFLSVIWVGVKLNAILSDYFITPTHYEDIENSPPLPSLWFLLFSNIHNTPHVRWYVEKSDLIYIKNYSFHRFQFNITEWHKNPVYNNIVYMWM